MKKFDVKRMTIGAAFSAIAVVLYCFVGFKMPSVFPSFLEFNPSMLPILILVFTFGTADGIIAAFIRMIGKIIFKGTSTSYVGELADLLLAIIVCLIAHVVYQLVSKKTKSESKRALITLGAISLTWIVAAVILNWLILVPAYIELFFHGSKAPLIGMCKCIKGINSSNYMSYYLMFGVVPFNLCLSVAVCAVTYGVHMATYLVFRQTKLDDKEIDEIYNDKIDA